MKTTELDVQGKNQPLMELDEQYWCEIAGGQYTGAQYTATNIVNFGLALGTGGTATATSDGVTAVAGTDGVAVVAGFVGSLSALY